MRVEVVNKSNNKLPEYESAGAAGLDVRACFDNITSENPIKAYVGKHQTVQFMFEPVKQVIMDPGTRILVPTGLYVSIPTGYEIQVRPRSGLTLKSGITVLNTPGTIDSDFRGEIGVILINNGFDPVVITDGERIAQLVLNKVEQIEWNKVDELNKTQRNNNGFGSTGK